MAGQQPQRGLRNRYSGQHSASSFEQDQTDDEYARACSYVQDQLRAQLGGQRPAWDGPIPGFWDRADAMDGQNQRPPTNSGQGKPVHETSRAQFHAQEQFRASQQGDHRASWNVPATGMKPMSGLFGHQHTQIGMPGPNVGQGQPATPTQVRNQYGYSQSGMPSPNVVQGQPAMSAQVRNLYGYSQSGMPGPNVGQGQPATPTQVRNQYGYTQSGMPGPNVGQGQPATSAQARNQYGHSPRQSSSQVHPART